MVATRRVEGSGRGAAYCAVCQPGYHSSNPDLNCVQCLGDEARSIALVVTPMVLMICVIGSLYTWFSRRTKRLILERLPVTVEVATGEDPADVWAVALAGAGSRWPAPSP